MSSLTYLRGVEGQNTVGRDAKAKQGEGPDAVARAASGGAELKQSGAS